MKRIDLPLLVAVILLTLFGLLMIYDASSFISFRDFGNKYHYIREQSVWMVLGFTCLLIFSYFDYHKFYNLSVPILIVAIVLLILVFVPGLGVKALGARRWINTRFFILQPAEFVKLGLAIYLSAWFSNKESGRLLAFCLLLGFILLLVMLEPDLGTATIILAESLVAYYFSGGSLLHFFYMIPAVGVIGTLLIIFEPYRAARLTAFLNFDKPLDSTSYHVKQILIALGMGGITGVGIGNSLQKFAYLPENTTDSIFAIIAEEFGFVGSVIIILVFIFIMWRGFSIASMAKDPFGRILAGTITTFLIVQVLINLGGQTALFPLAGVPLPFVSYGGSSLVVDLCSIGILLNISKQGKQHA